MKESIRGMKSTIIISSILKNSQGYELDNKNALQLLKDAEIISLKNSLSSKDLTLRNLKSTLDLLRDKFEDEGSKNQEAFTAEIGNIKKNFDAKNNERERELEKRIQNLTNSASTIRSVSTLDSSNLIPMSPCSYDFSWYSLEEKYPKIDPEFISNEIVQLRKKVQFLGSNRNDLMVPLASMSFINELKEKLLESFKIIESQDFLLLKGKL